MSQFSRRSSGPMATVVVDIQTFDIVHVYVNCHMRHAVHLFMMGLRKNLDPSYSDSKAMLQDALERYQFTETKDVTLRRG